MLGSMDNMNRPTGGDPQDSRSTEQFWPMNPASPGGPGTGQPPQPAGLDAHYERDKRRAVHWSIGLTLALAVAVGAVFLGLSLGGRSPASGAGGTLPASQAAALNSTLNSADAPGALALTSSSAAGGSAAHPCAAARAAARADRRAGKLQAARLAIAGCRGFRYRLFRAALLRGIDGQVTVRTVHGLRTLAFERGTVQSASGSALVVRATDGTTWTWDLVSSTVVREHGAKAQRSALATGQSVWAGGPVASGAKDARLIVIAPPGGAAGVAPSPAPSPSASPSAAAS
jgi:hypothetical protein